VDSRAHRRLVALPVYQLAGRPPVGTADQSTILHEPQAHFRQEMAPVCDLHLFLAAVWIIVYNCASKG